MKRKLAILVLLVFTGACTTQVAETVPEQTQIPAPLPAAHPMVAKISEILQPGWEVKQNGNIIVVSRNEPVSMYGNVAMPAIRAGLKEAMIERSHPLEYKITIEIGDLILKADRERMLEANRKTELELDRIRDLMGSFQTKGEFSPRNDDEKRLYEEYRTALRDLPYEKIPELYDEQLSYFVSTTRHRNESFSFPREERECRAVLENIFSFLDGYRDLNAQTKDEDVFDYPFDNTVQKVFYSDRDADQHQRQKEENLPEFRGLP